jgi:hypothetical protein
MPYATQAEYRAAIVAYRALHDVFYRFHRSVCAGQHDPTPADSGHGTRDAIAVNEHDYAVMVSELLPPLTQSYAGPPEYLDRLSETLRQLGVKHAAASEQPFDAVLTHQAYIDIDNILKDLLRERERYPSTFDEAFVGTDPRDGEGQ